MTRKQNTAALLRRIIREEVRTFQIVNETLDFNDPVLVSFRAAQLRRSQNAEKAPTLKPAEAKKLNSLLVAIGRELNRYYARRNQLLNDMEQEAEPGGGPIADSYGAKLDKLEAEIAKLITQRKSIELKLAQ